MRLIRDGGKGRRGGGGEGGGEARGVEAMMMLWGFMSSDVGLNIRDKL